MVHDISSLATFDLSQLQHIPNGHLLLCEYSEEDLTQMVQTHVMAELNGYPAPMLRMRWKEFQSHARSELCDMQRIYSELYSILDKMTQQQFIPIEDYHRFGELYVEAYDIRKDLERKYRISTEVVDIFTTTTAIRNSILLYLHKTFQRYPVGLFITEISLNGVCKLTFSENAYCRMCGDS